MNILKSKSVFLAVCVVAIAVPLGLSTLAVHADLTFILWASSYVSEGHLNVYDFVANGPHPERVESLTYPPLTYLFFGAIIKLGKLIGLFGYADWSGPKQLRGTEYLFVRALGYVPFIVLFAHTLRRSAESFFLEPSDESEEEGRSVFVLGLTSPIVLYVSLIFGQFDIIPTALMFAGVCAIAKGRLELGVAMLISGTWFKNFPVVFLVLSAPIIIRKFGWLRASLSMGGAGAATALLFRAFRSPGFTEGYLRFRHHQYDVIAWAGPFGLTVSLSVVAIICLLLAVSVLSAFKHSLEFPEACLLVYVLAMVSVLAPRGWMPQYIAWLGPPVALVFLSGLRLQSGFSPILYAALCSVYLFSVPVLFPGNVDSNIFYKLASRGFRPLGDFLHYSSNRVQLWTLIAVLLVFHALVALVMLVSPRWASAVFVPERRVRTLAQLQIGIGLSFAAYLAFVIANVVNLKLYVAGG